MVEGDEHFGRIGFGSVAQSAADTFSVATLPAEAEPDFIVSQPEAGRLLEINVEDVLVWDARSWEATHHGAPDIAAGVDKHQYIRGGLTKDNSEEATEYPAADSIAEGTYPGGNQNTVTGAATGVLNRMTVDGQPTRYVDRWDFFNISSEEVTAVGEAIYNFEKQYTRPNSLYRDDSEVDAHYLMTAAHYHCWIDSGNTGAVQTQDFGAEVRKISVDLKELLFDRAVLLSILDMLVVAN